MSSGHFHVKHDEAEAQRLLSRAWSSARYRERMQGHFSVNREYDIPYLAGYSKSGKIIYVDRHLPLSLIMVGKRINILPFLLIHERTEKALIDFMEVDYDEAHKAATYEEHKALKQRKIPPSAYERTLDPYIKADAHEKILKVPKDLDFKPYNDSRDLKLITRMREHLA